MPICRCARMAPWRVKGSASSVKRCADTRLSDSTSRWANKSKHGQGRPTGQGIAGVGVRMQEAMRGAIVPERLVHGIGGQHHRQRQQPPVMPLLRQMKSGRAMTTNRIHRLLVRKHGTGSAKAHGDFIGNPVDLVLVAQGAPLPNTQGHTWPCRQPLAPRAQNEGRRAFMVFGQVARQCIDAVLQGCMAGDGKVALRRSKGA